MKGEGFTVSPFEQDTDQDQTTRCKKLQSLVRMCINYRNEPQLVIELAKSVQPDLNQTC